LWGCVEEVLGSPPALGLTGVYSGCVMIGEPPLLVSGLASNYFRIRALLSISDCVMVSKLLLWHTACRLVGPMPCGLCAVPVDVAQRLCHGLVWAVACAMALRGLCSPRAMGPWLPRAPWRTVRAAAAECGVRCSYVVPASTSMTPCARLHSLHAGRCVAPA
jgi:hypothetical protein